MLDIEIYTTISLSLSNLNPTEILPSLYLSLSGSLDQPWITTPGKVSAPSWMKKERPSNPLPVSPLNPLRIFLFNWSSGQQHRDCVSCMGYYHAEGLLYTGSWDKTVKAWRVSDGKCVDSFLAHEDSVNAIVINQEDGCVFTCSSDGSVKIWRRVYDQSSHTLTMTLKFQPSPVNALALSTSHSSCFLYSGSSDGFINFWEKEKMSSRFNHGGFLQGHRFAVLSLVAIEKLIFSGSEDTTIRIWRREEGSYYHECLAVLDAHRGPVRCLAACLEVDKLMVIGFLVYSAGLDQTFKLWRVKVLPDEKNVCMEGTGRSDKMRITEYEMSPVLSPSWVEKKRQGNPT
nr:protein JINGUBANG-like [Coffea arabica]